jgi:hypothetical protein
MLLQIELALILEQCAADVVVDFPLETQQLVLRAECAGERFKKLLQRPRFENLLAHIELHDDVSGNAPGLSLF